MKKELQIFNNKEFGDIRIIEENGKSIRSKDCRVRRICMGFERYVILNSTKTIYRPITIRYRFERYVILNSTKTGYRVLYIQRQFERYVILNSTKTCNWGTICTLVFERYVILNSTKTYKGHRLNGVLLLSIINLCFVTP